MPLAGKVLLPREIAFYGSANWISSDIELAKMVATALGESDGSVGAWHDNLLSGASGGVVKSRDCGLMQDNIPASEIGTDIEDGLRTTSLQPLEWQSVVKRNVLVAHQLYLEPGPNMGKRRWEPWVSYTDGWDTFPAWWVWHQNAQGKPIGPWLRTGRYIQRAIPGVANYHLLLEKDRSEAEAITLARNIADVFEVEGALKIVNGLVEWSLVPPEPTSPPADGIGPRPIPNSGL